MDKRNLIESIVNEVTARVRRRAAHKSPYKKSLNQENTAAMRILSDPSDKNILAWSRKILVKSLGTKALNITDINVNDIRTAALLISKIQVMDPQQVSTSLMEVAKFSINNAQEQLKALMSNLTSLADKGKISSQQLTHDRIGNQFLLDMNSASEDHQKYVDTRKGLR